LLYFIEISNLEPELPSLEANEYADVIQEVLKGDVAEIEGNYLVHLLN